MGSWRISDEMATLEASKIEDLQLEPNENNEDQENVPELEEDWGDEFNNVVAILCGMHLNNYVEKFVNQGINLEIFLNLTADDLCHIGMTDSKDREVLIQGITKLAKNRSKQSLEVTLPDLSMEEVTAILTNTVKHLRVIHASLAHTRLTLRNSNVHNQRLNLNLTYAEVLHLLTSAAKTEVQLATNEFQGFPTQMPQKDTMVKKRWKLYANIVTSVGMLCAMFYLSKKYFQFRL